jgi:hypothetical protein
MREANALEFIFKLLLALALSGIALPVSHSPHAAPTITAKELGSYLMGKGLPLAEQGQAFVDSGLQWNDGMDGNPGSLAFAEVSARPIKEPLFPFRTDKKLLFCIFEYLQSETLDIAPEDPKWVAKQTIANLTLKHCVSYLLTEIGKAPLKAALFVTKPLLPKSLFTIILDAINTAKTAKEAARLLEEGLSRSGVKIWMGKITEGDIVVYYTLAYRAKGGELSARFVSPNTIPERLISRPGVMGRIPVDELPPFTLSVQGIVEEQGVWPFLGFIWREATGPVIVEFEIDEAYSELEPITPPSLLDRIIYWIKDMEERIRERIEEWRRRKEEEIEEKLREIEKELERRLERWLQRQAEEMERRLSELCYELCGAPAALIFATIAFMAKRRR